MNNKKGFGNSVRADSFKPISRRETKLMFYKIIVPRLFQMRCYVPHYYPTLMFTLGSSI